MGLSAGNLRRRVQIQSRATTVDSFGGQSNSWSTLATVWADINPLSGRELLAAQQVQAEVSHQITVRYQASIFANPKAVAPLRVVYNSRVFNVQASLNEDERNIEVTLLCVEGKDQG